MEQRISMVTLGVTDLARARAFYEALGWGGALQPDEEVCFFQAGGMVFGLWTALGGHGAPGVELAHNVRSPEEVDAVLAEAERAGGRVARPASRAEWGGYAGAFADPDGYVWEVAHNPGWAVNRPQPAFGRRSAVGGNSVRFRISLISLPPMEGQAIPTVSAPQRPISGRRS